MKDDKATVTLRPCPFCGGAAELRHGAGWDYTVRCAGCHAQTRKYHENPGGAIAAWNRRADHD